jgi:hypothetical protein
MLAAPVGVWLPERKAVFKTDKMLFWKNSSSTERSTNLAKSFDQSRLFVVGRSDFPLTNRVVLITNCRKYGRFGESVARATLFERVLGRRMFLHKNSTPDFLFLISRSSAF